MERIQFARQSPGNGASIRLSWIEGNKRKAERLNQAAGDLSGPDCPQCRNKGFIARVAEDGDLYLTECACKKVRNSLARIKASGLAPQLERYTLETWRAKAPWQAGLRQMAQDYIQNPKGWFCLSGSPGTGKSHLCTAVCGALLEQGREARYVLWRDMAVQAKALTTDAAGYRKLVEPLKTVPVLYIDDFFKTAGRKRPTDGDVHLAFEILNRRYGDESLLTIFSSELTIDQMLDADEAVGSRIYERAKDHYADLSGRENWRLAGG